jgi:hypothetical protein
VIVVLLIVCGVQLRRVQRVGLVRAVGLAEDAVFYVVVTVLVRREAM